MMSHFLDWPLALLHLLLIYHKEEVEGKPNNKEAAPQRPPQGTRKQEAAPRRPTAGYPQVRSRAAGPHPRVPARGTPTIHEPSCMVGVPLAGTLGLVELIWLIAAGVCPWWVPWRYWRPPQISSCLICC